MTVNEVQRIFKEVEMCNYWLGMVVFIPVTT